MVRPSQVIAGASGAAAASRETWVLIGGTGSVTLSNTLLPNLSLCSKNWRFFVHNLSLGDCRGGQCSYRDERQQLHPPPSARRSRRPSATGTG